jgi:hypothetical protein
MFKSKGRIRPDYCLKRTAEYVSFLETEAEEPFKINRSPNSMSKATESDWVREALRCSNLEVDVATYQ